MLILCRLRGDNEFNLFYRKLREKGKPHKKAATAVARKLAVKCFWDMLKCHQ